MATLGQLLGFTKKAEVSFDPYGISTKSEKTNDPLGLIRPIGQIKNTKPPTRRFDPSVVDETTESNDIARAGVPEVAIPPAVTKPPSPKFDPTVVDATTEAFDNGVQRNDAPTNTISEKGNTGTNSTAAPTDWYKWVQDNKWMLLGSGLGMAGIYSLIRNNRRKRRRVEED